MRSTMSRTAALAGAQALVLFGAAGRLDLPAFWIYLALVTVPVLAAIPSLGRGSPGLLEERERPAQPGLDRAGEAAIGIGTAACWLVAGLDAGRHHWSAVPAWLQIVALAGAAAGVGWAGWAVRSNRFFSSVVRLQADREQAVVTTGPYARVRHPGYAGSLLFSLCSGPALGSWWAVLPMAVVGAVLIRRTALEDALLRRGLPGYDEYARAVRFRLLPGLW